MSGSTMTATRPATLEMTGISKHFAGVAALTDVSVSVLSGEVHAVLGENGAGKSTLMNIASGTLVPDAGTISVGGETVTSLTPSEATARGIAIVHQHPAVLPDMTVRENLEVALPAAVFRSGSRAEVVDRLLKRVELTVDPHDRVDTLTVAQRHMLEIAKAFAVSPTLLILDEPTAPLSGAAVELFFRLLREQVAAGTSVIYITHRMAEVRELADRVTVLRDGRVRGTARVSEVSDQELLALILGRQLDSTFPPKYDGDGETSLRIADLAGPGFTGVSASAQRGQIVGLAGVVGNGQSSLLRALAGLDPFTGTVTVGGRELTARDLRHRAAFMPSDRHGEGLMMSLSVRENAAISALQRFTRGALVSRDREREDVSASLSALSVRAPSLEAPISTLSGGNQQKVVISRALLSEPAVLLADEPTQGVDVGARAEIYGILRDASARGVPVVVASSDAKELEGLCDEVLVMSRGQVVVTLRGDEVTEERIVGAAVSSRTEVASVPKELRQSKAQGVRRFLQGDYAPSALVALVIVVLAAILAARNERYLFNFNVATLLTAATALGFIALGQNIALLTGGIDLSVGPLAGFLVVVASFFVNDGRSAGIVIAGLVLMAVVAALSGLVNGSLIRFARFTPIAATLVLYIGFGGLALLLRPEQGGFITQGFQDFVNRAAGPLPLAFVVLVVVTLVLEFLLRRTAWGWRLRAVGSNEAAARSIGINVSRTVIGGYVATGLFVFLGAIMLMGQYGIGDPAQGSTYTLSSITAVVLGGTSLLGGRGTFLGPLLGAVLLQQALNATVFLDLGTVYQYYFQGVLILAAAILYTVGKVRRRQRAADAALDV
ncbi:MAG TPA: ATP-binding cassette domain-containing protein [Mycobacteriales bacterium]|jgi:ribose transport system ATP-binding protein|nr:ATP-binding cassette domain-containing protein [Mycobacteriales bacterium]